MWFQDKENSLKNLQHYWFIIHSILFDNHGILFIVLNMPWNQAIRLKETVSCRSINSRDLVKLPATVTWFYTQISVN